MRVVAGTARGRKLAVPPGDGVRPTGDRVRESVFNALGSRLAVEGARVVDLFAGTGALGIEALSRGAAHVTFVELDRRALAVVRDNVDTLGLADRATIVPGDALALLRGQGPVATHWDVALCDPPYRYEAWDELLAAVHADLVVVESDRSFQMPPGWQLEWHRRYGTTVVSFLAPATSPSAPTDRATASKE